MERKGRIHGYYYDGETQWVMYEDEDGYIEMREMEDDDEQQTQNGSKVIHYFFPIHITPTLMSYWIIC